ncbi:hypothetical protein ACGFYU_10020 [Streptomyces sp. NPDC048337]|uniref:hypothetical protein n=1 Tax=Streptomyces sp. NPDC048337 TaxID=3365535 RepID=UPI0037115ED1
MARAKKAQAPTFDRDAWEYLTYAPGHECSACKRTIKPLELVLRGAGDRASASGVIVYRHNECPGRASIRREKGKSL